MPTGLTSLEFVTVGDSGNADDTHGDGYGSVDYEYNIGKYEVTSGQYVEFLNAVAKTDTYGLYTTIMWTKPDSLGCKIERIGSTGSYTYSVASDQANRPVSHISWGDAARFANWLHNDQPTGAQDLTTTEDGSYYLNGATSWQHYQAVNRESDATWVIPNEDEWYKAAYYDPGLNSGAGGYYDYPTSSDSTPSNDYDLGGNNATFSINGGNYYTIGSPYYRTEAGAHENSDSPYGTFDQGGNIWEWTEATDDVMSRGWRGGSWGHGDSHMHASDRVFNFLPTDENIISGFRVAHVPEPATLTLLTLGGLALVRRRRHEN
jgi:formylglycine-generating enzyme required for sulfatase activity